MKKRLYSLFVLVLLFLTLIVVGCEAEPKAEVDEPEVPREEIVLNMVSGVHPDRMEMIPLVLGEYIVRVNEAAEGELRIVLLGAEDVMAIGSMIEACSDGTVDMVAVWALHRNEVPEVETLPVSQIEPWEEREVGYYDLQVKAHEKINLRPLGRVHSNDGMFFYTNKRIERLEDFEGLRSRSHGGFDPIVLALDMVSVHMTPAEQYGALERGVVDATVGTQWQYDHGLHEVVKYRVDHGFWAAGTTYSYINLDVYNDLPEHLQELLVDIAAELEYDIPDLTKALFETERARLKKGGLEFITLDKEEEEKLLNLSVEAKWDFIVKLMDGDKERAQKIRDMISK